jgi:hypothetical protein
MMMMMMMLVVMIQNVIIHKNYSIYVITGIWWGSINAENKVRWLQAHVVFPASDSSGTKWQPISDHASRVLSGFQDTQMADEVFS